MISPLSSHNLLTPTCELTAACSQQVVPAVYTIGRVWDGLIGKTLPCHPSAVNINMTGHQFYTLSRVWQKKKPHLSEFHGNGGARGGLGSCLPKAGGQQSTIAGLRGLASTRKTRAPVYWSRPRGEISCRHSWSHFVGYMLGVCVCVCVCVGRGCPCGLHTHWNAIRARPWCACWIFFNCSNSFCSHTVLHLLIFYFIFFLYLLSKKFPGQTQMNASCQHAIRLQSPTALFSAIEIQ